MHQTYTKLIELCYRILHQLAKSTPQLTGNELHSVLFCVGVTRCRGSWENTSFVAAPPCPPSFYKPPALSLPPLQLLVFLTLFYLTAEQQLLVFLFSPLACLLLLSAPPCFQGHSLLFDTPWYFWYLLVLLGISRYFLVLLGTCCYFLGFPGTFWYFLGHFGTFRVFLAASI